MSKEECLEWAEKVKKLLETFVKDGRTLEDYHFNFCRFLKYL